MSLVQEIQEIISDKSHTQNEMVSYIQSHYGKSNKTLVEITIPIFLQGNLDLGILNSLYPSLQYLYFTQKGKITGLYNIPKKLEQLHCTNQLLTELSGLPSSLQVLNISHNVLSKLDLFSCKQLKRLYCDHNRLIYISGLPESLLVIHCNNNRLNFLDLGSTPKLEVFRHHKNRQLVLRNVPSTIKQGFEFVEQMIFKISDLNVNKICEKDLKKCLAESEMPGIYFTLDEIASKMKSSPPKLFDAINRLQDSGFKASPTVFNPTGFRTIANIKEIIACIF